MQMKSVPKNPLIDAKPELVVELALRLWARQTQAERMSMQTTESNGIGYNKPDAFPVGRILTKHLRGESLTSDEVNELRSRLYKYDRQISEIVGDKELAKAAKKVKIEVKIAVNRIDRETDKAVMISLRYLSADRSQIFTVWLPKSKCEIKDKGHYAEIYVPLWLAREKSFVDSHGELTVASGYEIREKNEKRGIPCSDGKSDIQIADTHKQNVLECVKQSAFDRACLDAYGRTAKEAVTEFKCLVCQCDVRLKPTEAEAYRLTGMCLECRR